MKLRITEQNPHNYNRYGFAWEFINGTDSVLDFGCHDGNFLNSLQRDSNKITRIGVDVYAPAIESGNKLFPELQLLHTGKGQPLSFEDESFDKIIFLDVLEHIKDQKAILTELYRVLKDNGQMVVTVPGKHLFSFLDVGNYKFYFPRTHRLFYIARHGRDAHELQYTEKNPYGLIGDIEREKGIHEHFSRKKLRNLLNSCGFEVIRFDGTGFFQRLLNIFYIMLPFLRFLLRPVQRLDTRIFNRTNLFAVTRKVVADPDVTQKL